MNFYVGLANIAEIHPIINHNYLINVRKFDRVFLVIMKPTFAQPYERY